MNRTFELEPTRGQKSFYGKAKVIELDNGIKILRSYATNVCAIDTDGRARRLWHGWSATTSRHVNSFLEYYGFNPVNKKEWYEMPTLED